MLGPIHPPDPEPSGCAGRGVRVRVKTDADSAAEEFRRQRAALDPEMASDVPEDARERADAEARVIGDRHVMLAALLRGEAQVTPDLTRDLIAIAAQGAREFTAR